MTTAVAVAEQIVSRQRITVAELEAREARWGRVLANGVPEAYARYVAVTTHLNFARGRAVGAEMVLDALRAVAVR